MPNFTPQGTGFQIQNTAPVDKRMVTGSLVEALGLSSNNVYEGLMVYCTDDNYIYVLNDATNHTISDSWSILGGASAGGAGPIGSVQFKSHIGLTISGSDSFMFISESNLLMLTGSFGQGSGSSPVGAASHAEGYRTQAFGKYSHAEGYITTASGYYGHSEGFGTLAAETGSHAEGYQTGTGIYGYNSTNTVNGLITLDSAYGDVTDQFPGETGIGGIIVFYEPIYFLGKIHQIELNSINFNGTSTTIQLPDTTINVNEPAGVSLFKNAPLPGGTFAGGRSSHAEGRRTFAFGDFSHTEGSRTLAEGTYSHAEGNNTLAYGSYAHTEGYGTIAKKNWSHAEGYETVADGIASHTEGYATTATGRYAHAEGYETIATGTGSHAEGEGTNAVATRTHAEGYKTRAGAYGYAVDSITNYTMSLSSTYGNVTSSFSTMSFLGLAIAGPVLYSDSDYKTTITPKHPYQNGNQPTVVYQGGQTRIYLADVGSTDELIANAVPANNGVVIPLLNASPISASVFLDAPYAHAEGSYNIAIGSGSHAEGVYSVAIGNYSHVEGNRNITIGDYSHAEGNGTKAIGDHSHAEGLNTIASGSYSHAEGQDTIAIGLRSRAVGSATIAEGVGSYAEGTNTRALGASSHAEGTGTLAAGDYSHTEGFFTTASGDYAHAKGYKTIADGTASQAEGSGSQALGEFSHAEGKDTIANNRGTHAEGVDTYAGFIDGVTAFGGANFSHAEGNGARAAGFASHAEGAFTLATNQYAHAQGLFATASGFGSFAGGGSTRATGDYTTALGIKNLTSTGLFVIGNGTDEFDPSDANRSDLAVFAADKIILSQSIYLPDVQLTPDSTGRKYVLVNTANGKLEYSSVTPGGGGGGGGDITDVNAGLGISVLNSAGPEPSVSLDTGSAHFTTGVSASIAALGVGSNITINNNADNRVLTATGGQALDAEANLTFDGSTLKVTGSLGVTAQVSATGITGSLFSVRAGAALVANFGGSPFTCSINVAMGTSNYRVSVIGQDARVWSIQNKTATGFTINTNSTQPLTQPVDWMAVLDNS